MGFPKIAFRIVENRSCPLYEYADTFNLTGIAIPISSSTENTFVTTAIVNYPLGKHICKILNGDLAKIIIQYERGDKIPVCMISCSGCTGSIKVEHSLDDKVQITGGDQELSNEIGSILHVLSDFAFFKNIDEKNMSKVVGFFTLIGLARAGSILFWHVDASRPSGASGASPKLVGATLWLLGASVLMSVLAAPMQRYTEQAARQLVDPDAYARAVLGAPGGTIETTRPYRLDPKPPEPAR